jgi:hypothetical protein
MKNRNRKQQRGTSLDDIDFFELDGTPENIALVEDAISGWRRKIGRATAVLDAMKKEAGITTSTVTETTVKPEPDLLPDRIGTWHETVVRRKPNTAYPTEPQGKLRLAEGSCADICWKILTASLQPMSFPDFRAKYEEATGVKIQGTHRPYAAGIQRLRQKGHVVVYENRLTTVTNLKRYKEDVAAGRVAKLDPIPRFHSRWADAIVDVLMKNGGWMKARDITAILVKYPQFNIATAHTHVCTVLPGIKVRHPGLVERKGHGTVSRWRFIKPTNTQAAEASAETNELEDLENADAEPEFGMTTH